MRASPCQGCQSLSCSNFIRRRYLPQAYISCIDWVQLFRVLPKELFLVTCVSWTHLIQCLSSLVLFLVYFFFFPFFFYLLFFFFFLPILGRFFPLPPHVQLNSTVRFLSISVVMEWVFFFAVSRFIQVALSPAAQYCQCIWDSQCCREPHWQSVPLISL